MAVSDRVLREQRDIRRRQTARGAAGVAAIALAMGGAAVYNHANDQRADFNVTNPAHPLSPVQFGNRAINR